jgi:hypothetical protein
LREKIATHPIKSQGVSDWISQNNLLDFHSTSAIDIFIPGRLGAKIPQKELNASRKLAKTNETLPGKMFLCFSNKGEAMPR